MRFLADDLRKADIEVTHGENVNLDADVIVGGNCPNKAFADLVCSFPGRVVWDIDDDFQSVGKHNPSYDAIQDDARHLARVLDRADAIWTTTPYLCERLGYPSKTWHCPNLLDLDEAGRSERGKSVVWFGGGSHERDLETIAALPVCMPDTRFLFFGACPASLCRWELDSRTSVARCVPLLPNVGYMPPVKFERYWDALRGLPEEFGIALCPLDESDGFNAGKSPLKFLEATAIGCSVVAQQCLPYTDIIDQWNNQGWLASGPGEWVEAIRKAQAGTVPGQSTEGRRFWAWHELEKNCWQGPGWSERATGGLSGKEKWLGAIRHITSSMFRGSHSITWGKDT